MTTSTSSLANNLPVVGILGDGQLAMMMAQAYQKLGGTVYIYGDSSDGPASTAADQTFVGESDDIDALTSFYDAVDIVTLENEFFDSQVLSSISDQTSTPVLPDPGQFGLIEDKLSEKRFFQALDLNLAEFFEVKNEADLIDAPGFLKLAKGGYDGIGTYKVENKSAAIEVFNKIKSAGTILFERAVNFKKELSMIAVAGSSGINFYPMFETHQEDGTCRYVSFPAGISEDVELKARTEVQRILEKLETFGLFAFEYFLTQENELILNESAPRPHNSGHITLDLTDCSQFENHMRAISGLPLKEPHLLKESMLMANLLGTRNSDFDAEKIVRDIDDPNTALTLYQKKQTRIKRKMGHINLWGPDQMERAESLISKLVV